MNMSQLQIQLRIIYPTEWPADQIEEAKAEFGVSSMVDDIAARYHGATVVLDCTEIAGPSESGGMSNGYTS